MDVVASLLYGNIAIYAAFDRKPKLNDYDFTNVDASHLQDSLHVVSVGKCIHSCICVLD